MKKHWPTLLVIFCIILYMVGFFWYGVISDERYGDRMATKGAIKDIMIGTLQIPAGYKPGTDKLPDLYSLTIDNDMWFDLEPVDEKEWMNIDCKLPDNKNIRFDIDFWFGTNNSLTEEEKKYLYCIRPGIRYSYKNMPNNKNDFLLPNDSMFNEPCIIISFHEYVLQYPKILRNILKIAEKPCDYLKNFRSESYYRGIFCCDSFGKWPYRDEKTCIIIRIVDSEANLRHQIVVPRKDNNHLFNLK